MTSNPSHQKTIPAALGGNPARGGRFANGPAAALEELNNSLRFDRLLWRHDIMASLVHATMLKDRAIIPASDAEAIIRGLEEIRDEIASGAFFFDNNHEDIHMAVEARLTELIGPAAGKLHTARSRNDQVATDFRLWLRDQIDDIDRHLRAVIAALLARARDNAATIMPGYTHLQPAQPVTLGHHLMAYVAMFFRDLGRLRDSCQRMNESPLGAAALAGTSFPIDRHRTARDLGFDRPMDNSMDAVSARDFVLEFLAAAAILATHLSRLAEEFVLWSSPAFGFIRFSDAFSTGSSIMPQKRNPDAAELIRGKAGRIHGALAAVLTVIKGLPLAYAKDLQEDKEPVFDCVDTLHLCLIAMEGMIADFTADPARMLAATRDGYLTATDLADWLVQKRNYSFRTAHDVVGRLVRLAEAKARGLEALSLAEIQTIIPDADERVRDCLSVENSVARRKSFGGTAPARVLEAIMAAEQKLKEMA